MEINPSSTQYPSRSVNQTGTGQSSSSSNERMAAGMQAAAAVTEAVPVVTGLINSVSGMFDRGKKDKERQQRLLEEERRRHAEEMRNLEEEAERASQNRNQVKALRQENYNRTSLDLQKKQMEREKREQELSKQKNLRTSMVSPEEADAKAQMAAREAALATKDELEMPPMLLFGRGWCRLLTERSTGNIVVVLASLYLCWQAYFFLIHLHVSPFKNTAMIGERLTGDEVSRLIKETNDISQMRLQADMAEKFNVVHKEIHDVQAQVRQHGDEMKIMWKQREEDTKVLHQAIQSNTQALFKIMERQDKDSKETSTRLEQLMLTQSEDRRDTNEKMMLLMEQQSKTECAAIELGTKAAVKESGVTGHDASSVTVEGAAMEWETMAAKESGVTGHDASSVTVEGAAVELKTMAVKGSGVMDHDASSVTVEGAAVELKTMAAKESGVTGHYASSSTVGETKSDEESQDLGHIQFLQRLYMYQHAVSLTGQKLLHFILRTLICGDINNISGCVKEVLTSKTQYKKSFTKDELQLLEKGEHRKWDILLLFKIIQKVCGLAPAGTNCWTQHTCDDDESLEYLITKVKELRNKLVHNLDLVLTEDEMDEGLTELVDLSIKMTKSLGLLANKKGKQFSEEEATKTIDRVFKIITDVRENINKDAPTTISIKSSKGPVAESVENDNDQ